MGLAFAVFECTAVGFLDSTDDRVVIGVAVLLGVCACLLYFCSSDADDSSSEEEEVEVKEVVEECWTPGANSTLPHL